MAGAVNYGTAQNPSWYYPGFSYPLTRYDGGDATVPTERFAVPAPAPAKCECGTGVHSHWCPLWLAP